MSWYKTGTIAATNGSKIITGTGTQFTNSLNGVSAGRMLLLPAAGTVQIYEIESVQSDTQLTLVSAFTGTTGTGKAYAIPTTPTVSIEQFAHEFASTLAYYQQQLSGWQQILTGTGNVTLTTPDGQSVTVRSQQAWDAALTGKADLTQTFRKRGLLGTVDLNTITGEQDGVWTQHSSANATPANNYPTPLAGSLLVVQGAANGNTAAHQLYFPYNTTRVYIRYFLAGGTWGAWAEIWNSASLVPTRDEQVTLSITTAAAVHAWALANSSRSFRNDGINADASTIRFGSGAFTKVNGTYSILTAGPSASTAGVKIQAGDANGYLNYNVWTDRNLTPADMYGARGTLGTADLDTIFGQAYRGVWDQGATANATLARHYPVESAGSLEVIYNAANAVGIIQRYTTHASNRVFIRYKARNLPQDTWSEWVEYWTSSNLVKQTGQFDATSGSVMLNGAFGLGGRGEDFEKSEADFLSWARNINNGSRFFRNTLNTKYTQPYGASILFRSVDTWGVLSVGYGNQDGVKISGGNASGSNTRDHYLWTDKNLPSPATTSAGQSFIGNQIFQSVNIRAGSGNTGLEIGRVDGASSSFIDFHSSGNDIDYDARIIAGGGSAAVGQGTLNIISSAMQWNGVTVMTTGMDQTIGGKKIFNRSSEALQIKALADNQSCFIRGQKTDDTPHWYIGKGGADFSVAWANQHSTANCSMTLREDGHIYLNVSGNKAAFLSIGGVAGRILSQGHNAVADANGFWKTASPVVKLFANGTSELTSEAEGITTERLSEGVYRISGCLGLNADRAWGGDEGGIDVPMCRNKLPRLWVDYGGDEGSSQINPDGSIVIRTYHRPHPDAPAFARNEIEGYANGDPIDIPHDTFISVRVQMPAVEAQEAVVETVPNAVESDVVLETSMPV